MRTDWAALFRHGVLGLRLAPEAFWRLSWREWQMLNAAPEVAVLRRQTLEDLMRAFPDE
ncbi:MAG: phage tail assembly chaperone [Asticcacaulis sp.]|uniref:rcc01693 family protein n=1 Tax=Asticcacaulis sp. TaxID=1872648 RepID=UPI0039E4E366